jgi:DNA-binding NarL/FixJ family response regulator
MSSAKVAIGLVRDLFFRSKIDAVAAALGATVAYASSLDAAALRCAELKPDLVFADLSDATFPALETIEKIRAVCPDARMVGFASHVDLKPLRAAREAGFELTLSRSEFTARLPDLLKP